MSSLRILKGCRSVANVRLTYADMLGFDNVRRQQAVYPKGLLVQSMFRLSLSAPSIFFRSWLCFEAYGALLLRHKHAGGVLALDVGIVASLADARVTHSRPTPKLPPIQSIDKGS